MLATGAAASAASTQLGSLSASLSGEDQRWAFAIDALSTPNSVNHTSLAELSDGSVVLAAHEKIAGLTRAKALHRCPARRSRRRALTRS